MFQKSAAVEASGERVNFFFKIIALQNLNRLLERLPASYYHAAADFSAHKKPAVTAQQNTAGQPGFTRREGGQLRIVPVVRVIHGQTEHSKVDGKLSKVDIKDKMHRKTEGLHRPLIINS